MENVTKAVSEQQKYEEMGKKAGAVVGGLLGGVVGAAVCVSVPVIPWAVGTYKITKNSIFTGMVAGYGIVDLTTRK